MKKVLIYVLKYWYREQNTFLFSRLPSVLYNWQWVAPLLSIKHSWYWTQVLGGFVSHRYICQRISLHKHFLKSELGRLPSKNVWRRFAVIYCKIEFVVFLGAVKMVVQFSYHLTFQVALNYILLNYCFLHFCPNMFLQSFGQLFR